jgi:type IV secretion system protein VirD4
VTDDERRNKFSNPLGDNFDFLTNGRPSAGAGWDSVGGTASLGAKLLGLIVHRQQRKAMATARREQRRAMDDVLANPPPIHGSAVWANAASITSPARLSPIDGLLDPRNIFLGRLDEAWLSWDGEGHLLTVAPTRSGKSTMQIIPNLLRYKGSAIVLDPKGELYEKTAKWRSMIGDVYRVAPFEANSHAFNPLDSLRTPADARALADLMIPEDPRAQEYFRKDAISFLNGVIQYTWREAGQRATLGEVRNLTAMPIDSFIKLAEMMSRHPDPGIANAGSVVAGKNRERSLPGLRDTLNTELSLWDDAGVRQSVSRADFRFHDLKDRTTTIYITVPFDKMAAFAPYLRVVLASALDAMIQNQTIPTIPVLFVLDEFLSLGTFTQFRDALRTHAGAGVRLWFFLQNLSTLEELYPTSWRAFLDASVQSFFGTSDTYTGNLISELLGDTTQANVNTGYSVGMTLSRSDFLDTGSGESLNVSHNVNLTARRLLTPSEVVQRLGAVAADGSRQAIVSIVGSPPIGGRLVPYFKGELAEWLRTNERL